MGGKNMNYKSMIIITVVALLIIGGVAAVFVFRPPCAAEWRHL